MLEFIIQWLAAPLVFVVWFLFMKATKNEKDIAILNAQYESNRLSYDREMKEMKNKLNREHEATRLQLTNEKEE